MISSHTEHNTVGTRPTSPTRRVVVFRLGHLGDVTLITGVLASLGHARGWDCVVVTRRPYMELFTGHPYVSQCVGLDEDDLNTMAFIRVCRKLREMFRGDTLMDLHGTLRSRLLSFLWNGPVLHYPKLTMERRLFLSCKGPGLSEQLLEHTVTQRYYLAAATAVPPPDTLRPRIYLTHEERSHAYALLQARPHPVALHPHATHALKTWPANRWKKLIALLDAARVPWICIGKGTPLLPGHPHDFTNAFSLRETCAVLSLCRVLVTGDSGPMHLASAVDTPILALFGPTTREWGFYPGAKNDIVLEHTLPCRPCSLHGKKPCPRNGECLTGITSQEVMRALHDILDATKSREFPL